MKFFDFGAAVILIVLLGLIGHTAVTDKAGKFHGNPVPYISPAER